MVFEKIIEYIATYRLELLLPIGTFGAAEIPQHP